MFRLYRRRFGLLWGVSLIASIPSILIAGAFAVAMGPAFSFTSAATVPDQPPMVDLAVPAVVGGLTFLLVIALAPILAFAPVQAALVAARGEPATVGSVLGYLVRRYGRLWLLLLLQMAIALTLVIPPLGIWLLVRFSLAGPAALTEEAGPGQALGRSWNLLEGSWWRVFGVFVVAYLIVVFAGSAISTLGLGFLGAMLVAPPDLRGWVFGAEQVVSQLLATLVAPLLPLALVLVYFDVRVRREALDLQVMAWRAAHGGAPTFGSAPPPPPTPPITTPSSTGPSGGA